MSKKRTRTRKDRKAVPVWVWLCSILVCWIIASSLWQKSPLQAIEDSFNLVQGKPMQYKSPKQHSSNIQVLEDSIATLNSELLSYKNATPYRRAIVATEANSLNLRSAADLTSDIVIKIPDSSTVEVLYFDEQILVLDGSPGKWCKVRYADKEGWVWGNYVKLID